MIKKIISSILVIKPIKLLVFKFIHKGKSLVIKSEFVNLKTNIGNNVIIMEGSVTDHLTNIGDYCYIGRYCYLTKVKIGNYCSIANVVGSFGIYFLGTIYFIYKKGLSYGNS